MVRKVWRVVAVAVAAALLAGAASIPRPQVVGGDVTPEKQPWIVSIWGTSVKGPSHVCGGSLIAPRWVLTAAHCLDAAQSYGYAMRIGVNNREEGQLIRAKQAVRHPQYDPATLRNDIGLLELNEAILGTMPISLQNFDIWESAPVRAMGWGVYDNVNDLGSVQLRQVDTKVITGSSCEWAAGIFQKDQMYCYSAEKMKQPCLMDSGGPVLHQDSGNGKWRLIGIINGGDTYCPHGTDYPWFGMNINRYRSWITTLTGLLHAPGPFA